ncbi:hypothetical protein D3C71_1548550 [compost metagenome]
MHAADAAGLPVLSGGCGWSGGGSGRERRLPDRRFTSCHPRGRRLGVAAGGIPHAKREDQPFAAPPKRREAVPKRRGLCRRVHAGVRLHGRGGNRSRRFSERASGSLPSSWRNADDSVRTELRRGVQAGLPPERAASALSAGQADGSSLPSFRCGLRVRLDAMRRLLAVIVAAHGEHLRLRAAGDGHAIAVLAWPRPAVPVLIAHLP